MELCSDLLYVNHSCAPNVAFDVPGGFKGHDEGRWAAKALKDIKKGDVGCVPSGQTMHCVAERIGFVRP